MRDQLIVILHRPGPDIRGREAGDNILARLAGDCRLHRAVEPVTLGGDRGLVGIVRRGRGQLADGVVVQNLAKPRDIGLRQRDEAVGHAVNAVGRVHVSGS